MDPFHDDPTALAVQAAGVLVVAGLLRPLARLAPGRFLARWAAGWAVLAVSVGLLAAAAWAPDRWRPGLLAVYLVGQYGFAALVWAGCRELAGRPAGRRPLGAFAGLALAGLVAPAVWADPRPLFPAHAAAVAGLFAAAYMAVRRADRPPASGLWLLKAALAGHAGLYAHYAGVTAGLARSAPAGVADYLDRWAVYELLLEAGLAFGMVAVAADRVRAELEERARRLADLTRELSRAAATDPLTGLLNRRAVEALVADPPADPFAGAVAVLDMNDLKPLNDRYGHPAGDAALQLTARALRNLFRVTDPVVRLGGDEFLVVVPGWTADEMAARLTKLGDALRGHRLPGCPHPVDLRAAWGTDEFAAADGLWEAVARADAAMYRAKAAARRPAAAGPSLVTG